MSDVDFSTLRRLPVYLLLDCSGSMAGEPIVAMETGIKGFLADLQLEPQALETVWFSVITFATTAEQLVPLTDINLFIPPKLEAAGTTALGDAYSLLSECIEEEVRHSSQIQKGDWLPLVFVFTDGEPNPGWEDIVSKFKKEKRAKVIVCGAGTEVDIGVLKKIGDQAIKLENTQPGTLAAFMKWVSASVTMQTKSLGTVLNAEDILPPLPEGDGITIVP